MSEGLNWAWNKFSKNPAPLVVATLVFGLILFLASSVITPLMQAVSPESITTYDSADGMMDTATYSVTAGGIAVLIGTVERPALGWSGLIIAVVYAIVALVLLSMGKGEFKRVKGLPRTAETVSKIPNAATGNEEKNR